MTHVRFKCMFQLFKTSSKLSQNVNNIDMPGTSQANQAELFQRQPLSQVHTSQQQPAVQQLPVSQQQPLPQAHTSQQQPAIQQLPVSQQQPTFRVRSRTAALNEATNCQEETYEVCVTILFFLCFILYLISNF